MSLSSYITNCRGRVFKWGENDCLSFVSGGLAAQGFHPLPAIWFGDYTTVKGALIHYRRTLRSEGFSDIIEAMDDRYGREFTLSPGDGLIAAKDVGGDVLGFAFGLVSGGLFVAMSEGGITRTPLVANDMFWRPQ